MIVDLSKKGLSSAFKPWQVPIILEMFGKEQAIKSADAHRLVAAAMGNDNGRSRASIINFLEGLVKEELATFEERTGKGGHHKIYTATCNLDQLWAAIWGWADQINKFGPYAS